MSSVSERKRRQIYRGEVFGQLPFDTKGMDDPVPTIDFSPSGNADSPYSLERDDVDSQSSSRFFAFGSESHFQASSASWMTLNGSPSQAMTLSP